MFLNNFKNFSTVARCLDKNSENINKELNVNFNKDLDILSDKVNKLVSLQKEINPLYNKFLGVRRDVLESADKFLNKHNISNNLEFGKLNTYLNSQMDMLTLLDILGDNGGKEEIVSLFRKIKSGSNIDIKLLSRDSLLFDFVSSKEINEKIMNSYSDIIKDIDSIEFNNTYIEMDQVGCLIGSDLYDLLENSFKYKRTCKPNKTDEDSFYVVVFNMLKSKESGKVRYDLIYNYTQYNKIFLELFYVYISIQQLSMIIHNKLNIGSSYFFCMDSNLTKDIRCDYLKNIICREFDIIDKVRNSKPFNFIDLCKICVKGTLIEAETSFILKNLMFLVQKDYYTFLSNLHYLSGNLNNTFLVEYEKTIKGNMFNIYNPTSRFIYIVSDLKGFTNDLQKINDLKDIKSVNPGSQKFRGSTSYLNNILSRLDKDFRDSMYNHNLRFLGNKALKKSKFSFKNVHMNLGYSR